MTLKQIHFALSLSSLIVSSSLLSRRRGDITPPTADMFIDKFTDMFITFISPDQSYKFFIVVVMKGLKLVVLRTTLQAMDKSSALDYINQMFPTEASLSGVEPLMQKIRSEIRPVDAGILAAVRQQSNSGTKPKEDLAAATCAVEELMYKIQEVKTKAEQSETMIQEICLDIKKLDFAKKHITTTITALHRLTMLVMDYKISKNRTVHPVYNASSNSFQDVNQLCNHFEAYRDIPMMTELREKFKNIKQILKSYVFSDFSRTENRITMNAYIPEASTCGVTEAALAVLSSKRNNSKLYQIKLCILHM
ncbi:hypothetical protein EZV62_013271 [Acer yangbiense]|uniref:Vps53 N-terminal domain-containing protein n=1 Tax=Acer yangbiense TaxID=1000413 RepID=A0A5C7HYP8_9ROSI|nr:hypothetical protein EZV62_013271 [Acer yangbiense]